MTALAGAFALGWRLGGKLRSSLDWPALVESLADEIDAREDVLVFTSGKLDMSV